MWGTAGPVEQALLLAGLLAAAFFVFSRVRLDYRQHGRLTRPVAVLQTGWFCVYALCSYIFLDSRFSHIRISGPLLYFAVLCMSAGVLIVALSMPFLGRRSFGVQVGGLRTCGLYRCSRNPQLAGSLLVVAGYALLWPSWSGALWAVLWLPVSWLMVRGEEEHLARVFGEQYREYCARTPRYWGRPGK